MVARGHEPAPFDVPAALAPRRGIGPAGVEKPGIPLALAVGCPPRLPNGRVPLPTVRAGHSEHLCSAARRASIRIKEFEMHIRRPVFAFLTACGIALPLQASVHLYVDTSAPPAGDGLSWATAFQDLQAALTLARNTPGLADEIWVADGTYKPTTNPNDPTARFELVTSV